MATNGTSVKILVNTGTDEVPVYEVMGCQRDATIEESTDTIDASCKDSRAQRVLPGRYSSTISLDAVWIPDDDCYLALQAANRDGEMILVSWELDDVVQEIATAKLDSITKEFPDQDVITASISMTVDGWWTEAGS